MVLPTAMRLRGHRCFHYLHRKGQRFHGTLMTLRKAAAMPQLCVRIAALLTIRANLPFAVVPL